MTEAGQLYYIRCRMIACASPDHLSRHGTPRTPEELGKRRRLAYSQSESPGDWTFVDSDGRQHTINGQADLSSNNVQLLASAALKGAGVAYGPTFAFGAHLRSGALVALLPDFSTMDLGVHAIYPSTRFLPTKVRRLIDQLAKDFGDNPPWDA